MLWTNAALDESPRSVPIYLASAIRSFAKTGMEHLVTFDQEQQALLNRAFEMLSVVLESAGTDTITLTRDVDVVGSRCPQKVVLHVLRGQPAEEVMLYVGGVTRGQH